MSISPGMAAFRLAFQLSPILFVGGIAANLPGLNQIGVLGQNGVLPIILITQALSLVGQLLTGGDINLDDFFANFVPLPGSKLASNQFGHYPFANQAIAANARIKQPLTISLRMICPARDEAGYALKLATMTALQAAFAQHDALGGTYIVATPSYFYTNCVLLDMTDTSNNASMQAQNTYQLDFEQPLLTLQDAQQAQGSLMSSISAGLPFSGAPSSFAGATALIPGSSSLTAVPSSPTISSTGGGIGHQ